MRTVLFAGLAMAAGLGAAAGAAAQDDDWEFQQDPAQNITIAAARYDAGQMIVVQCRGGALTAVLTGLPQSTGDLTLTATRADGRSDVQTWTSAGAPGSYRSAVPARDIRFMRGGGLYRVHTAEGETPAFQGAFDLPSQSANLDRVLTACGWGLTDDRDALPRAAVSLLNPEAGPIRPTRRGATSRSPRRQVDLPPPPSTPAPSEGQKSCIVRELRLTDCRTDHPSPPTPPEGQAGYLERLEGRPVFALGEASPEGGVYYVPNGPVAALDYLVVRRR